MWVECPSPQTSEASAAAPGLAQAAAAVEMVTTVRVAQVADIVLGHVL
jgi:hypothetical protein